MNQRFHILKEVVKKGEVRYMSLRNNKLYKTTDLFVNISDKVSIKANELSEVVEQVMNFLEIIIEKEDLEFLG